MTKKQQTTITLLSLAIIILLLLLSRRLWVRMDMTANKAYTLSPVSRNLHTEIEESLRITHFLSGRLVSFDPAFTGISDILREYEARSRGKIRLTVKDPGKNPAEADRYGLMPQQFQNVEQGEASFAMVYSGILIEYLDKYEVLPWVSTLDSLEYDITSRIRSLVSDKRRELGVIAPEQNKSWNEYYGMFNQILEQSGYSVRQIRPREEIPDTLPALFVFGGEEVLDEYSLYHIDRYIQLGGRVLFGVESINVDFSGNWEGRVKYDKGLLAMVSWYGATVGQSLVLDRASLALPYRDPETNQFRLARYAPWIGVMENQGNPNHPLTSHFMGVDLYWACPLTLTLPESGTVTGEVLFSSSPDTWLMEDEFVLRPDQSAVFSYLMLDETVKGKQALAVALEGRFPSWFAEVDKPEPQNEWEEELPDMPLEPKESRIIVIGDSDLGGALVQYTQAQQGMNLNFLLQAADWLGNDDDIVGIRNRASASGRLDKITDSEKRSGIMTFSKTVNVFIVPILIVVFGISRLVKRNRKKEQDHAV